jgi:NADH-quinone oxidoreductase subunit J
MRRFIYLGLAAATLCGAAWAADLQPVDAAEQTVVQTPRGDVTAVSGIAEAMMFYAFAFVIVGGGLGVVLSGSVVRMAVWLFTSFSGVALLFFLLQAHFLAAVQLIVYVGGILVLIVFGIMLTSSSPWLRFDVRRWEVGVAGAVCLALCAALSHALYHTQWAGSTENLTNIKIDALGRSLITDYLVPFELAAVLLMIVMIGAAYLARQTQD